MTTAYRRTNVAVALAAIVLLSSLTATRALANDTGKILGALAAGYVAYEILDELSKPQRCGPPPMPYCAPPHDNYNPPSGYYAGGEARYWYKEGYKDGFKDGENYGFDTGYEVGYSDGDRNGYRRGTRDGYRIGYGDGYDNGHHDGFIQGSHRPGPPPRRGGRW